MVDIGYIYIEINRHAHKHTYAYDVYTCTCTHMHVQVHVLQGGRGSASNVYTRIALETERRAVIIQVQFPGYTWEHAPRVIKIKTLLDNMLRAL